MKENPINAPLYIVYTGNRINQILIFPTWDDAANWCRECTRWTEIEIARAIKVPHWTGGNFISVTD